MNLLTKENLNKAINKIFDNYKEILKEKKEIIELINNNIYPNINKEHDLQLKEIKSEINNKIIKMSIGLEKVKELRLSTNEKYKKEIIELINSNVYPNINKEHDLQLKENKSEINNKIIMNYTELSENNKYEIFYNSIINNNFKIEITGKGSSQEINTILIYEKKYKDDSLRIDIVENDSGYDLWLEVSNLKDENLNLYIKIENSFKIMKFSLMNELRNTIITYGCGLENFDNYLESLKENNLLSLDNKEIEELYEMSYDINLNLRNEPLYQTFKEGFNDFLSEIKQALSLENKIENKNSLRL